MAEVRGRHLADLPRCGTWLVTLYCMAEAAYLLGDVDAAAEVYELLLPFADRPAMTSLGITCFGSVNLALGLALVTLGELDDGLEFLSGSLCRNLALGHLPAVNVAGCGSRRLWIAAGSQVTWPSRPIFAARPPNWPPG